jgi:hypothetical protein
MHVWEMETHLHFVNQCVPWKVASGAEYLVLQALQLIRWVSATNSQMEQA